MIYNVLTLYISSKQFYNSVGGTVEAVNENKKIEINKFFTYFLGLILLAFGVVFTVKANYGVTVAASIAYVFSQKIKIISFGTFSYIVQGIVFLLMIANMRKINLKYILAFLTSVISGYSIDGVTYLLGNLSINTHILRIIVFILSVVLISMGLVLLIKSKLPILPFDMFVMELSLKYNIKLGKFKRAFDIICFLIAAVFSFIFFGKLNGLHLGTILSALAIGPCIDLFISIFDRYLFVS